jgi:hypothetical protein
MSSGRWWDASRDPEPGPGWCVVCQAARPSTIPVRDTARRCCHEHIWGDPPDPPRSGRCEWQQGHLAGRIWHVPSVDKDLCAPHIAELLRLSWKI